MKVPDMVFLLGRPMEWAFRILLCAFVLVMCSPKIPLCDVPLEVRGLEITIDGDDFYSPYAELGGNDNVFISDGLIYFNGSVTILSDGPVEYEFRDLVIVDGNLDIPEARCTFEEGLRVYGDCNAGSGILVYKVAEISGNYSCKSGVTQIESPIWIVGGDIDCQESWLSTKSIYCDKGIWVKLMIEISGDVICFDGGIYSPDYVEVGGDCFVTGNIIGSDISVDGDLACQGSIFAWAGNLSVDGDLFCSEDVRVGGGAFVLGTSEVLGKTIENIANHLKQP